MRVFKYAVRRRGVANIVLALAVLGVQGGIIWLCSVPSLGSIRAAVGHFAGGEGKVIAVEQPHADVISSVVLVVGRGAALPGEHAANAAPAYSSAYGQGRHSLLWRTGAMMYLTAHPRRDLYPRQVFQHWRIGGKTWRARTCYIEAAPGLQIEARFVEPVLRVMRVGEDAVEATLSPPGLEGRLCVHLLGHEEDAALWERTLSSGKHLVQDLPPAAAQALLVRWEVREVTAAAGVKAMDAVEEAAAG